MAGNDDVRRITPRKSSGMGAKDATPPRRPQKVIDFFRNGGCFVISMVTAFLLIVAWITAYCIWLPQTHRTVTAKVIKEWVQCSKDECTKLIGTDHGVFEDQDSALYWKWNSSDFYNNMSAGNEYTFSVVGWRIPFLSTYPNIITCEDCS